MSVLVCEDEQGRVVVDRDSRHIRFEHCHHPKSWLWPRRATAEFTCSLEDIVAVHLFRVGEYDQTPTAAAIVTRHGRAILSRSGRGVETVIEFLREECQGRGSGPWLQNPSNEKLLVVLLLLIGFGGFAIWIKWFSGWAAK